MIDGESTEFAWLVGGIHLAFYLTLALVGGLLFLWNRLAVL
jgi:hypothetical protein